jgi:hypothetical protein
MSIRKLAVVTLFLVGVSAVGVAAAPVGAPEIDPGMALNALALLGGLALMVRAGRRK